jgi:hypothetical protein
MQNFMSTCMYSQREERPPVLIQTSHQTIWEFLIVRQQLAEPVIAINAVISNNTGDEIIVGAKWFLKNEQLPYHGFGDRGTGINAPLIAHAVIDITLDPSTRYPIFNHLS